MRRETVVRTASVAALGLVVLLVWMGSGRCSGGVVQTPAEQRADFVLMRAWQVSHGFALGLLSETRVLPALFAVWKNDETFVYVDVGAHVGSGCALVAHLWGRPTLGLLRGWAEEQYVRPRIVAVEPMAGNLKLLAELRDALPPDTMDVEAAALSDSSGTVCLERVDENGGGQLASVNVRGDAATCATSARATSVDEFWAKYDLGRVSMFKIDTEGHDPVILRALRPYLVADRVDVLLFEVNVMGTWTSTSLFSVVQDLAEDGFDAFIIGDHRLYALNGPMWSFVYEMREWYNVLAVRRKWPQREELLRTFPYVGCDGSMCS